MKLLLILFLFMVNAAVAQDYCDFKKTILLLKEVGSLDSLHDHSEMNTTLPWILGQFVYSTDDTFSLMNIKRDHLLKEVFKPLELGEVSVLEDSTSWIEVDSFATLNDTTIFIKLHSTSLIKVKRRYLVLTAFVNRRQWHLMSSMLDEKFIDSLVFRADQSMNIDEMEKNMIRVYEISNKRYRCE